MRRPTVEVSIRANAVDAYELPITLKLYGLPESAPHVMAQMRVRQPPGCALVCVPLCVLTHGLAGSGRVP